MAGWFEIRKSEKNGQYSFVLKAGNGEIILTSEQYVAKSSAENGIESVRTNSPNEARYEKLTSSNAKPYFNLKAANGQVIGTSQLYSATDGRDKGIESVKTNGSTQTVKDNT